MIHGDYHFPRPFADEVKVFDDDTNWNETLGGLGFLNRGL